MLVIDLPPELRAHVSVALREHCLRLRRDGHAVPPELHQLADAMLRPVPAASGGQARTLLAQAGQVSDPASGTPVALMLRPPDAAALLGVSPRQLRRLAAAGEIESIQDGRSRRYRPADLAAYVEAKATNGARPIRTAERAAQLDALDEQLARQRFETQAMPGSTGDRFHDLAALDDAIVVIDERWNVADVELRQARAEAGPLPDLDQHREIVRLERRAGELSAMRSRAIMRRDRLEAGPEGPFI